MASKHPQRQGSTAGNGSHAEHGRETMTVRDTEFLRDIYNLKYLFGDKWMAAIAITLADGPMRRIELLSTINSYRVGHEWSDKQPLLHDSILARTLKKMTEEGLLVRTERAATVPSRVYYSVIPEIVEFLHAVAPAAEWARRHRDLIARARAYSRRHGGGVDGVNRIAELDEVHLDPGEDGDADHGDSIGRDTG